MGLEIRWNFLFGAQSIETLIYKKYNSYNKNFYFVFVVKDEMWFQEKYDPLT